MSSSAHGGTASILSTGERRGSPDVPHWALRLVFALAAVVVGAAVLLPILTHPSQWQWDFLVYYYAAGAPAHGLDPYAAIVQVPGFDPPLRFVYPPVLLWAFRPFATLDPVAAGWLFLCAKLAALAALCRLLLAHLRPAAPLGAFALFGWLAFGGATSLDVGSGNVSTFEQLAIWSGFFFLLGGWPLAFCACIVSAALFKIVPVVFLAVLLLHPHPRRIQYLAGAGVVFLAGLGLQALVAPGEFAGFLANVSAIRETGSRGNPSSLALAQDTVDLLQRVGVQALPDWTGPTAWAVFVAAVLAMTVWTIRGERFDGTPRDGLRLALVCATAAIVLPRFKTYSYMLLLVPAWMASRHVARDRPHVQVAYLGLLCLSAAAPVARLCAAAGLDLMPRSRIWWFVPLAQALLVWGTLLTAVREASVRSGYESGLTS